MMNKHLGGFIWYHFTDAGADDDFVLDLLDGLESKLKHMARECSWDSKSGVLTTPDDTKTKSKRDKLKSMSFSRNIVKEKLNIDKATTPGAKESYTNADNMFKLDDGRTVKTVHEKNDGNYTKTKSPEEVIDLSGNSKASATSATPINPDPRPPRTTRSPSPLAAPRIAPT